MSDNFSTVLSKTNNDNVFENFVTPITPYFICDHFISTEVHPITHKYIGLDLKLKANDLLKNQNYHEIKDLDIIQVQIDHFYNFCDNLLPYIESRNIQVIIITSQEHLPQIHRNHKTDMCLNHKNILLWISQNPIYINHPKYMAFPYGILQRNVGEYIDFLKSYEIPCNKSIRLLNQFANTHPHLPMNHIRNVYPIFGVQSGSSLPYPSFLTNISNSEYVISTAGDREDCYRHYESIGLNAIPVSNIAGGYVEIFEDSMVYSNPEEMVKMVTENVVENTYKCPNRNILLVSYWVNKMNNRIMALTK
jgi:hypothetical protein